MKDSLIKKLHEYIRENNPDVLMQLQEDGKVTEYLSDRLNTVVVLLNQQNKGQPACIVEETCMEIMTRDLRPSKYNYIINIGTIRNVLIFFQAGSNETFFSIYV